MLNIYVSEPDVIFKELSSFKTEKKGANIHLRSIAMLVLIYQTLKRGNMWEVLIRDRNNGVAGQSRSFKQVIILRF
jgi:hypothetical protein